MHIPHLKNGFLMVEAMGIIILATVISLVFLRAYAHLLQKKATARAYVDLVDFAVNFTEKSHKSRSHCYAVSEKQVGQTRNMNNALSMRIVSVKDLNSNISFNLPVISYHKKKAEK